MKCNLRKGWPLCPKCDHDEIAILDSEFDKLAVEHRPKCPPIDTLLRFDWYCYVCGRVVWFGERARITSFEVRGDSRCTVLEVHAT